MSFHWHLFFEGGEGGVGTKFVVPVYVSKRVCRECGAIIGVLRHAVTCGLRFLANVFIRALRGLSPKPFRHLVIGPTEIGGPVGLKMGKDVYRTWPSWWTS